MSWIQTHSGFAFDFTQPHTSQISIVDIAHALSHLCRFAGHVNRFYSVAEHSVYVSRLVPRELALQGLLHDAAEAYVVDLPKPLKDLLPNYRMVEADVWLAVCKAFHLPTELDPLVKEADIRMLLAERDQLLGKPVRPWTWGATVEPARVTVRGLHSPAAKLLFLDRFYELTRP